MTDVCARRQWKGANMPDNIDITIPSRPLAVAPAEGARLAGVGRTKFYEALGSGAIPSFKFGSRRLIRVSAIEEWLAAMEEASQ